MTFFKRNFFSRKTTIEPGDFQDWKPIGGTGAMLINRNLQVVDVLPAKPSIQVGWNLQASAAGIQQRQLYQKITGRCGFYKLWAYHGSL